MQYISIVLYELNLVLVLVAFISVVCYAMFGIAFFEWLAKLLRGNDDDDDSGGGGGNMQPVLVPVRIND